MAVKEAPYLTNCVVLLLMLAVFALCLCADRLQCQNNGWSSMCIGKLAYRCSSEPCRSYVSTPTRISRESSCVGKGDAVVLIALVEVGPSVVSERGKRISHYMADELRRQVDAGEFQRAVRQTLITRRFIPGNSEDDARRGLVELFREKEALQAILDISRNHTRYTVVNDAVPLPAVDGTDNFRYTTWSEAVNAALPVSKLDDASQLPRYFPNLFGKLVELGDERAASTASSSSKKCDALVVVVCTIAHPLASVRLVWQTPWNAGTELSMGHEYVRGAVTRYLMTCRQSLRYVNEVYYFQYVSRLPALAFTAGALNDRREEPFIAAPNATAGRVPAPNNSFSFAAEFCNAVNATAPSMPLRPCGQTCEIYSRIEPDLISGDYNLFRASLRKYSSFTSTSSTYNCYYEVLSTLGGTAIKGTFDTKMVSRVFDDCLHFSPEGGRAYAKCLLRG
ncbi:hypothetical protein Q4I30_004753 [Leishmania utingensis]|uniref:Membrane-associated protein n=1 Tax=Leishmania utingensis TaxID=653362 RepID=A0AAW3AEJ9_9TRYP